MDITESVKNPNPRENANPISIIFWWWIVGLFRKGYSKVLGEEDLYEPLKADRSNILGDQLEARWFSELKKAKNSNRKPSFLKAIFRTFFLEYFFLGIQCLFGEVILSLAAPLFLGSLLGYFKPNPSTTYEKALFFAGGILLARLLQMITVSQFFYGSLHAGGKIRIAVCSVIYRKALRLSKTALGETSPGKIVNLVANDVNRFDIVSFFLHYMWCGPLLSLIVGNILYARAGYAGLIGIVAIFIVVPIQAYTGKLSSIYRLKTALKTDERVRLMDEIISSVQVIKMYAWEKPYCVMVELARHLELKEIRKSSFIRGIFMTFDLFTTRAALYTTLMGILLFNDDITAEKVFVFSSLFQSLANTMTIMFVRGFAEINECLVAVNRLQTFLTFEEVQNGKLIDNLNFSAKKCSFLKNREKMTESSEKSTANTENDLKLSSEAVEMVNVKAIWNFSSVRVTLEDVNVKIEKRKLHIVIGMVGSGKSSFLSTILREINIVDGELKVNGLVSYADQDAWVFGGSVRQNILFGQELDGETYQKVIEACALKEDFKQLPQGDQTVVGERGSSLSGGQKARINLARSVYRQADIYLLDDPLSAVDAHVGKHLFENCIKKHLNGKTRILVTHQLQFIRGADSIIFLDQGRVRQYNDYRELLKDPKFQALIAEEKAANDQSTSKKLSEDGQTSKVDASYEKSSSETNALKTFEQKLSSLISAENFEDADEDSDSEQSLLHQTVPTSESTNNGDADAIRRDVNDSKKTHPLTALEISSRGVVPGNLTVNYFNSGISTCVMGFMLALFIITQVIVCFNDYFMQEFISAEESRPFYENYNGTNITEKNFRLLPKYKIKSRDFYVIVYSIVVPLIFVIGLTRSFVFYCVCMRCSQRLHDFMFGALIRASMRFFDTNPSGRILNRFSKDIAAIDELLPKVILDVSHNILVSLGALIVICTVSPILLIPILVIMVIFYWVRKVYLKTSKNIKRLEGMTKSPVFTHLNTTLNGITTIRAYGAENILKNVFDNLQDTHTSAWYMFLISSMAYNFVLDSFTFVFTALVICSSLLLDNNFCGGQVGLIITQAMATVASIQWGMRQAAAMTNQLMAVERVLEYTQIPPESNLRDKGAMAIKKKSKGRQLKRYSFVKVPKDWPNQGCIEFRNVYMRYSEEDPIVLRDLTLTIHSCEKVGIVGRTGAGKSSLIAALFRLAKVDGGIEIDGIDTGAMALEDLRKHISIIPQTPVLFSGTLRRNLDPFEEYSDETLWNTLEEVELKTEVSKTGNGLDHRVLDRGSNYSVGQRQLICLARAILRNNRILVLDEATANVDPQTDALIQRTIRTKFAECTILTVAHRLNTIMDSDRVLVMDNGSMVEYDRPHLLLQNADGQFTSLVKETGLETSEKLRTIAYNAYLSMHQQQMDD